MRSLRAEECAVHGGRRKVDSGQRTKVLGLNGVTGRKNKIKKMFKIVNFEELKKMCSIYKMKI